MKWLLLFFSSFSFYGQLLHHQMISSQGGVINLSNGLIVNQTIGQQSLVGSSKTEYIILQGFQQSIWSKYISTNSADSIITKTYPNPFEDVIKFQFSQSISDPIAIDIFDTSGRLVFENKKNANDRILSVELPYLPASQYLVHLYAKSFSYFTQIIKL